MDDEDNEMQAQAGGDGPDEKKGKGERRTIEVCGTSSAAASDVTFAPSSRPAQAPDNNPMLYMDDILDKLKLLDYEIKFCAEKCDEPPLLCALLAKTDSTWLFFCQEHQADPSHVLCCALVELERAVLCVYVTCCVAYESQQQQNHAAKSV
jgi:hypothetical protein